MSLLTDGRDAHETRAPSPRELKALIEAERTGNPFIYWRDGAGQQHILLLAPEQGRVTIGRREQSGIPLIWDSEVSRAHALLEPIGEAWTLVDDGISRNGSFVNGGRVVGRYRRWTDDPQLSTRISRAVAHYTGQAELS